MAKILRYALFLIPLILGASLDCGADTFGEEIFHNITTRSGLEGESVSCVLPSRDGRVYLGTSSGVSLYDGSRLLNFPLRAAAEGANYVYDICEDSEGVVYAATSRGIFRKLRPESDFSSIYPQIVRAECLLSLDGVLYAGNREGFHILTGDSIRTVTVGASRMGVENGVRDIVADSDGNIWFLSRYALNCYKPSSAQVVSYPIAEKMPKGAALNRLALREGKFYVGTKNNGLYLCSISPLEVLPIRGIGNVVTCIDTTSCGDVTVSCDGAGAFLIDGKSGEIKESYNSKADPLHRLPNDAVYCFTKDDRGVCWFGFYRYGLCHTWFSAPVFRRYALDDFSTEGLAVRSFYIGDGVKLIGTGDGLYFVDELKRTVRFLPPSSLGGGHIITAITQFSGLYYIATYDAGLHVLDPESFTISRIAAEPLLSTTSVACFAVSPDQKLWVGTGEGVFVLDGNGKCTEHFTENNSRIAGGMVSGLLFDAKGNCWVSSKSLSIYVASTGLFENSNFPKDFFNSVENLNCVKGHDDILYFIRHSHIYYTDPSMTDFGQLNLPDELQRGTCYSFLDDEKGGYWIATSDGLFRTDYAKGSLQHFGLAEGMRCRCINSNGVRMDSRGNVWVGTSDGLMALDPEALEEWQSDSLLKARVCQIRRGGNLLDFSSEDEINSAGRILLGWNFASEKLSLRFLLRDYANSVDRIYSYSIDGGQTCRTAREGEDVSFGQLGLGKHKLRYSLAGAEGTESLLEILVVPSAGAVAELLLALFALGLLIMWHRYHRDTRVLLRERGEIESALIEMEQESEALKEKEDGGEREKYSRVKLDPAECEGVVLRMKEYIDSSRCYTDPELKMSDLAAHLGISASKLSQIFSLYLKENYYEFINRYRLEEYKRLLSVEENRKRYTLTSLSEQCGFRKSNFYSTFRRVEGMTPAEYLKKHNIKV